MLLKIQTIRLPQDNQCWRDRTWKMFLICGCGDAQPITEGFVDGNISRWGLGVGGSRRCCVAPCDLWQLHVKKKKERVCSQWDVYALREQWSKTSSLNPKSKPPSVTHTHITPFNPIYKHYLYFVHTLAHAHTHSHWACSCWVTSWRTAFVVTENLWFSFGSAGALKVQHTNADPFEPPSHRWDCQSFCSSSFSSSCQRRAHVCFAQQCPRWSLWFATRHDGVSAVSGDAEIEVCDWQRDGAVSLVVFLTSRWISVWW